MWAQSIEQVIQLFRPKCLETKKELSSQHSDWFRSFYGNIHNYESFIVH